MTVKRNVIANLTGSVWVAAIQLACVPVYLKLLGVEAYGLIGFYATLQGALQVLDFGLSPTMNREMARYSALNDVGGEARDFVRTLESGYWLIAILIGGAVFAAAPLIANHWVHAATIPRADVSHAVMVMGAVAAFQWPVGLYQGGLLGLQRQTTFNAIRIFAATLGSGGAVLILWKVSPTISAFFFWQAASAAVQVGLMAVALWRALPASGRSPRLRVSLLRSRLRFAAGLSGIALISTFLFQLDKIVLSRLLSLETFGYYVLAGTVANGLYVVITPVFNAVFPRFSALVAEGDTAALRKLYHEGTQLMAVLVLPLAAVLCVSSYDAILAWTGNAAAAANAAPIASLLVLGTALNGLLNLPFALQLAYGWTSLAFRLNAILAILLVPAITFAVRRFGVVGAAAVWPVLNALYIVVAVPLTHRKLLRGTGLRWFGRDVLPPMLAATIAAVVASQLIGSPSHRVLVAGKLTAVTIAAILGAGTAADLVRNDALRWWDSFTRDRGAAEGA